MTQILGPFLQLLPADLSFPAQTAVNTLLLGKVRVYKILAQTDLICGKYALIADNFFDPPKRTKSRDKLG